MAEPRLIRTPMTTMHPPIRTLAELESEFLSWLSREVAAGRSAARTLGYYRYELGRFRGAVGADRPLAELVPYDLERHKRGWHSVQAVQRLFNWADEQGLFAPNPFRRIKRPPAGQRERVLSRAELVRMLRGARHAFRHFLVAMASSIARPQEIRSLRWGQLLPDGSAFALTEFKAKKRRKDGVRRRYIPVNRRLGRLLARLRRRRPAGPDDFVFVNSRGMPWTRNALRCRMRLLRRRCGLVDGGELVVCYTLRHTAATTATANGLGDKMLAEVMGHASTRTTARYQHPQLEHLTEAIGQATRRRKVS
jgi:integrase